MTLDQLRKRGRHLANECPLCGENEETIEHILIQCSKVREFDTIPHPFHTIVWNGI